MSKKLIAPENLIDRMDDEVFCGDGGTGLYQLATGKNKISPEQLEPGPVKDAYTKFYEQAQKLIELEGDVMGAIRMYNII